MFWSEYGSYCVMGNYGSGKTSWTFRELVEYDKKKTYIIANVPYLFVDKKYDTPEELNAILNSLINYCKITNRDIKKYFNERFKYKNIVIIVDEAHRYFDARKRKMYSDELDVVLSQCRKRNIQIFFISQRLKRLDLNIRRLSDFVIRYSRYAMGIIPNSEFVDRMIYCNEWDLADIQWDETKTYIMSAENEKKEVEQALYEKGSFRPLTKLFWFYINKRLRGNLADEYYNTLYICGLDMSFINENDSFLSEIRVAPEDRPKPKTTIEKLIPTFYSLWTKIHAKWYDRSNSLQRDWDKNGNRTVLSWNSESANEQRPVRLIDHSSIADNNEWATTNIRDYNRNRGDWPKIKFIISKGVNGV